MNQQKIYLHKRKNGYYCLVITSRKPNTQKRHFKFVSCRTKQKSNALIFLKNYEKNIALNQEETNSELKLLDIKQQILDFIKRNKSKGSYEKYELTFRKLVSILGNKKIIDIDFNEIERFKAALLTKINANSVNIYIRVIKAIWNYAYKMNIIKTNSLKFIKQIKTPDNPIISFTKEEINIIEEKADPNFRNMIKFARLTGLRISEMLHLQTCDIKNGQIHVSNKKGFTTKSRQNRCIPINTEIKQVLDELLCDKTNKIMQLKAPDMYLFSNNKTNLKLNRNYVSRKFKKLIKELDMNSQYHWHTLRAYFIMSLVRRNINPIIIRTLTGQSSLSVVDRYCKILSTDLKDAMNY